MKRTNRLAPMTLTAIRLSCAVLLLMTLIGSGCAVVKPWEREQLARRDMGWEPDPLEAAIENHIHFSKEATMPGGSAGGGGCGCN